MNHAVYALSALALLTACAADPSQNRYNYNEVGQSTVVDFATVVAVKPVEITGRNTGTGMLVGATAGGLAANQVGGGSGKTAATVGGVVAGAAVGAIAEQMIADKKGYEYLVVTERKETRTIVQHQAPEDIVFNVGDRVMVQTSGTYQRVLPTTGLPDSVKKPQGIKIVD